MTTNATDAIDAQRLKLAKEARESGHVLGRWDRRMGSTWYTVCLSCQTVFMVKRRARWGPHGQGCTGEDDRANSRWEYDEIDPD